MNAKLIAFLNYILLQIDAERIFNYITYIYYKCMTD